MVNQQTSTGTNTNTQPSNNNNNNMNAPDSILRSTFVIQPDSSSSARTNETLRSRSADSRPSNTNRTAANLDDDDADWIDLPAMDIPMPPQQQQQLPTPPMVPMPRLRGPAIIRKFVLKSKDSLIIFFPESIDRSLPCASPYFTQTLRPPGDNATNLTSNEGAALGNVPNRAVVFATGPQRPRGRHRHPAGPWAQQNQQQQMQNFMFSSPGAPTGATVLTPAGHAYNMTAHSFEIPMVISTTTEIPQQQTSNDNAQQQPSTNDGQQMHMVNNIRRFFHFN